MAKRNGPPARLRGVATLALAWWLFQASVGCTPRGGPEDEGPGRRPQMLALTPEQELELGREAYREILAKDRLLPRQGFILLPLDGDDGRTSDGKLGAFGKEGTIQGHAACMQSAVASGLGCGKQRFQAFL
jgi:hypothetical protein